MSKGRTQHRHCGTTSAPYIFEAVSESVNDARDKIQVGLIN